MCFTCTIQCHVIEQNAMIMHGSTNVRVISNTNHLHHLNLSCFCILVIREWNVNRFIIFIRINVIPNIVTLHHMTLSYHVTSCQLAPHHDLSIITALRLHSIRSERCGESSAVKSDSERHSRLRAQIKEHRQTCRLLLPLRRSGWGRWRRQRLTRKSRSLVADGRMRVGNDNHKRVKPIMIWCSSNHDWKNDKCSGQTDAHLTLHSYLNCITCCDI